MPKTAADALFEKALEAGASDVHVAVNSPILFRINGKLEPQTKQAATVAQVEQIVKAVIDDVAWKRLQEQREVDTSYGLGTGVRLRINCHFERGNLGLVARIIPSEIPSLEAIGIANIASRILPLTEGLVLFTGPTGTGKSTSLAALIHSLNQTRPAHIVTVEDPIEFIFPAGKGLVRQREYGHDFLSFPEALKRMLRQDPNIAMVGEMRDPETIAAALTLAETGHLTFATLHTPNTTQTIDRIVDVFPPHQQAQVRSQLSMSLKMIVAQKLVPNVCGGRVALREILINIPAVANTIREGRTQELTSVLQTNESIGMITFEKAAKNALKEGIISQETHDAIVDA